MNGKEAIIKKIATNAETKSREILAAAEAEANQILAEATAKAQAISDTGKTSAKAKADAVYDSKMATASRQSNNVKLNAKQAILDEIYGEAQKQISKMSDAEYKKFIGSLILKHAQNGDEIVPGKADKKTITADFISGLTASKKIKLSLSKEVGGFEKGVILSNKNSDNNLSLEMLLRESREKSEAEVLKLCTEVK